MTHRKFVWDSAKAASNALKHDLIFEIAVLAFDDPDHLDFDVTRDGEAEERRKVVGQIGGKLYTVVYTQRGMTTRIISGRRANRKEEKHYADRDIQA